MKWKFSAFVDMLEFKKKKYIYRVLSSISLFQAALELEIYIGYGKALHADFFILKI